MASSKNGFETKLLKAKDFKEQGTKLLNEGNFKAANGKYHQVLDSLGGKEIGPHETERKDLIQVNFCQPLIFVFYICMTNLRNSNQTSIVDEFMFKYFDT